MYSKRPGGAGDAMGLGTEFQGEALVGRVRDTVKNLFSNRPPAAGAGGTASAAKQRLAPATPAVAVHATSAAQKLAEPEQAAAAPPPVPTPSAEDAVFAGRLGTYVYMRAHACVHACVHCPQPLRRGQHFTHHPPHRALPCLNPPIVCSASGSGLWPDGLPGISKAQDVAYKKLASHASYLRSTLPPSASVLAKGSVLIMAGVSGELGRPHQLRA